MAATNSYTPDKPLKEHLDDIADRYPYDFPPKYRNEQERRDAEKRLKFVPGMDVRVDATLKVVQRPTRKRQILRGTIKPAP